MCILLGWFSMDWIVDNINTSVLYFYNIKNFCLTKISFYTQIYRQLVRYLCVCIWIDSVSRRHQSHSGLKSFYHSLLYIDHINVLVKISLHGEQTIFAGKISIKVLWWKNSWHPIQLYCYAKKKMSLPSNRLNYVQTVRKSCKKTYPVFGMTAFNLCSIFTFQTQTITNNRN